MYHFSSKRQKPATLDSDKKNTEKSYRRSSGYVLSFIQKFYYILFNCCIVTKPRRQEFSKIPMKSCLKMLHPGMYQKPFGKIFFSLIELTG